MVAGSNTHHTFTISQLTLNFYSATVIIRYASQEQPGPEANPAKEEETRREGSQHPAFRGRQDNTSSAGDRPKRAQTPGIGVDGTQDTERIRRPRIRFAPELNPVARPDSPLLPEVGAWQPEDLVRTASVDIHQRNGDDGSTIRLQGRYPDLTPVTDLSQGSGQGSTLGPIHSVLPKISNLRLRK